MNPFAWYPPPPPGLPPPFCPPPPWDPGFWAAPGAYPPPDGCPPGDNYPQPDSYPPTESFSQPADSYPPPAARYPQAYGERRQGPHAGEGRGAGRLSGLGTPSDPSPVGTLGLSLSPGGRRTLPRSRRVPRCPCWSRSPGSFLPRALPCRSGPTEVAGGVFYPQYV